MQLKLKAAEIKLIFILNLRCSFAGAELQAARCLPVIAPQTLDRRLGGPRLRLQHAAETPPL